MGRAEWIGAYRTSMRHETRSKHRRHGPARNRVSPLAALYKKLPLPLRYVYLFLVLSLIFGSVWCVDQAFRAAFGLGPSTSQPAPFIH